MYHTETQIEHAINLSVEDAIDLGVKLNELSDIAESLNDGVMIADIGTLFNMIATNVANKDKVDRAAIERLDRCLARINDRASVFRRGAEAKRILCEVDEMLFGSDE